MSDISNYQQNQIELTRKIIFKQDKEVLRQTAHSLAKSNNDSILELVKMRIEYEKLLHVAEVQAKLIEKIKGKTNE